MSYSPNITLNDIIYVLVQAVLVYWTIYSIYYRFIKFPLPSSVRRLKKRLKRNLEVKSNQVKRSLVNKYKKIRLFLKIDKTQTHHIIIPDPVKLSLTASNAKVQITRGEDSWQYFGLAWTVLSVFYIETNASYSVLQRSEYSIIVTIFNLAAITWLCFCSSWFRNWIIRLANHRNKTPD